tara:strand:- start:1301 stop:2512 length:1212 start_codon:yes stop_codon:yes gene_type:complete
MRHPFFDKAYRAFMAGVVAADPVAAVQNAIPSFERPPTVISVGKAGVKMIGAAIDVLGKVPEAIVVTNPENAKELEFAEVFVAAHPIPDLNGLTASCAVIKALERAGRGGRPVLCLISGGGSALLPAPINGVSLAEKIHLNSLLIASGADIKTINLIRQQVSRLKGGRLLEFAVPSSVTSLIISDVIGDDLRAVASGLTVGPIGTSNEAIDALKKLNVWHQTPNSIRISLAKPRPILELLTSKNILIGSNKISLKAMAQFLPDAQVHSAPLIGDVAYAAERVSKVGRGVHLFGGETTVKLKGSGLGGRNQELALRVALLAHQEKWTAPWLYLQAGTDGRDGPTDAAGGVVCDTTFRTMIQKGIDPEKLLKNNDSYHALLAANALLMTNSTGTNVADLGILMRG